MSDRVDGDVEQVAAAAVAEGVPPDSDVTLLGRYLARADMDAFTTLVDRHQADLLRVAYAITHDVDAAEDAVQEGFLRLCREGRELLASAGGRSGLGGWLCAVVRNQSLDHLRRRKPARLPAEVPQPVPAEAAPADSLWAAVETLPPLERAAVLLRYREHLDYRAVAERLGKSVNHVGVILHQAMHRLRTHPGLIAEAAP